MSAVTIPPLKDLLYEQCGFVIPMSFTLDFVELHGDDWVLAEREWESDGVIGDDESARAGGAGRRR